MCQYVIVSGCGKVCIQVTGWCLNTYVVLGMLSDMCGVICVGYVRLDVKPSVLPVVIGWSSGGD